MPETRDLLIVVKPTNSAKTNCRLVNPTEVSTWDAAWPLEPRQKKRRELSRRRVKTYFVCCSPTFHAAISVLGTCTRHRRSQSRVEDNSLHKTEPVQAETTRAETVSSLAQAGPCNTRWKRDHRGDDEENERRNDCGVRSVLGVRSRGQREREKKN